MRAVQVRAVNHGGRNSKISADRNNKGTTALAVASPAGSHVAVDASMLEPRIGERVGVAVDASMLEPRIGERVGERHGYWFSERLGSQRGVQG